MEFIRLSIKMGTSMNTAFNDSDVLRLHRQIDTPALFIFKFRMENNLKLMQQLAAHWQKQLRPHVKTHKSVQLAKRQIELGASGISVAKLSEAEVMAGGGIGDIFIANQITQPLKLQRLRGLHQRIRVILGLDHPQQIELLRPHFKSSAKPLEVRVEIDSGLQRCGVQTGESLIELVKMIIAQKWLKFDGVFTHAGQVYAAKSSEDVAAIGKWEGELIALAREQLAGAGIACPTVSVGSTPTAPYSVQNDAVTEIRPGNYIFYDAIQLALGATTADNCALFVLATVISQPASDRLVIDAGSKALHVDRGAHATALVEAYGIPVNLEGKIVRLSEEHGVIQLKKSKPVKLGSPVLILPNHACAVVNLFDFYYVADEKLRVRTIPIEARGKSQ